MASKATLAELVINHCCSRFIYFKINLNEVLGIHSSVLAKFVKAYNPVKRLLFVLAATQQKHHHQLVLRPNPANHSVLRNEWKL